MYVKREAVLVATYYEQLELVSMLVVIACYVHCLCCHILCTIGLSVISGMKYLYLGILH